MFCCLKGVYSPSGQLSIENSYFPILFIGKSGTGAPHKKEAAAPDNVQQLPLHFYFTGSQTVAFAPQGCRRKLSLF